MTTERRSPFALKRPRRGLAARAGYTVVEVMIALGILAVGGTAIIAMQRVTVMGTINSQNLVNSAGIASGYLGRIQGEAAASWTPLNPTGSTGTIFNRAMSSPNTWIKADPDAVSPEENALTLDGRVDATRPTAYCSFVRAVPLTPEVARFEVRTLYMKAGQDIGPTCALAASAVNTMIDSAGTVNDGIATRARDEYGIAFAATAVRRGQ